MLTPQLSKLLSFLDATIATDGYCPSYAEMMIAMELRSKSSINRMILELEDRGFVRRLPGQSRAIEVIRRLETASEAAFISAARAYLPADQFSAIMEIASGTSSIAADIAQVAGGAR